MNVQQAILFKKNINQKFLVRADEGRKHNNTPVGSSPTLQQQMPRRRNHRLPIVNANEQIYYRNDRESDLAAKESSHTDSMTKCPFLEGQEFKNTFINARKIEIKLPCLAVIRNRKC